LRVLIDKALYRGYVLSPLAAPHHRREGLVFRRPSNKGKQSRPSPGGGRGKRRLPYQQTSAGSTRDAWFATAAARAAPDCFLPDAVAEPSHDCSLEEWRALTTTAVANQQPDALRKQQCRA
jgi:hypothetical protein